ncbi:MAG TPA: hypothetical protein V6C99_02735 [Oculatellaceae cyanobacterium]|jgi:hypothetical protein
MAQSSNLNEECLLQFLSAPLAQQPVEAPAAEGASLTDELKRIYRRDRYVSFPPAILIRRQRF